jgi:hypothetical protein
VRVVRRRVGLAAAAAIPQLTERGVAVRNGDVLVRTQGWSLCLLDKHGVLRQDLRETTNEPVMLLRRSAGADGLALLGRARGLPETAGHDPDSGPAWQPAYHDVSGAARSSPRTCWRFGKRPPLDRHRSGHRASLRKFFGQKSTHTEGESRWPRQRGICEPLLASSSRSRDRDLLREAGIRGYHRR